MKEALVILCDHKENPMISGISPNVEHRIYIGNHHMQKTDTRFGYDEVKALGFNLMGNGCIYRYQVPDGTQYTIKIIQ